MTLDCSDVCEIIHSRLVELGFEISDDEDHRDMIEALNKTRLVTDEEKE